MQDLINFLNKYNVEFTVENNIVIAEDVDLSCNNLQSLPDSIGNMKCNSLILSNNKLQSLPESFGNMKCNYLYLSFNKLQSLPDSIGNMTCNTLHLFNNNLQSLPDSFKNLKCNTLILSCNDLQSLPDLFGNMKCNNLDLSYNNLQSLPDSIGNMKCNALNLSCNKLQSLSDSIENMKCNNLHLPCNNLQSLPEVRKFDSLEVTADYIYCDGILTWYESKKVIGEYTVYIGYFNSVVVSDNNGHFAHGDSIRQCISDIHFKKSDRDTSKYKNLNRNEQIDINECIVMYRTITGACSGGVESFLQNQNVKDSYSVNEIIELTENQYGHELFLEFFN